MENTWKFAEKNWKHQNKSRQDQCSQKVGLTIEFFTNVPKYKNANIINFVLAVPLEKNCTQP